MPRSQTGRGFVRGGLATLAVVAGLASGPVAYAQSPDDIAAGRQLFLQKGNCQSCHGWAGDGCAAIGSPSLRSQIVARRICCAAAGTRADRRMAAHRIGRTDCPAWVNRPGNASSLAWRLITSP